MASLTLTGKQDDLVNAVAAANPHTVVVLETGGPALMPWIGKVNAALEIWYPGVRGAEAMANVLFGDVNPSRQAPHHLPHERRRPSPSRDSRKRTQTERPPAPAAGARPRAAGAAGAARRGISTPTTWWRG